MSYQRYQRKPVITTVWEQDFASSEHASVCIEEDHLLVTLADDGVYGVAELSAYDARAFATALWAAAERVDG